MTRTTELLKGCGHKDEWDIICGEKYAGGLELCPSCKSELRGRLDALKEEFENLQKLGLIKIKKCSCFEHELMNDTYDLVYKRLASIQEEIKLIEKGI